MSEFFDPNQYDKNLYVIKHQLSAVELKPHRSYFEYYVDNFYLKIVTKGNAYSASPEEMAKDRITFHEDVEVYLYEEEKIDGKLNQQPVCVRTDDRFVHFNPAKTYHSGWTTQLTINELCELIRYLRKLKNLLAFL